jgi:cell division protein ZapA
MNGKSIKVKIFGSEYPLRGENEDLTKKVAAYVDAMLNKIHERIPEQPPLTVAVLSALNISEDLLREREQSEQSLERVTQEITKISNYLDNCLAESPKDHQSAG